MNVNFEKELKELRENFENVVTRKNSVDKTWRNGIFERYENPVVTAAHAPIEWRYDLNEATNPYLMERIGVNAVFNPGAMYFNGKYCLVCRVEGYDRKSFFAIAESDNGIDNFRFRERPITLPETENPDVNVYDMRLVEHEDGWIYGLFCTERKDPDAPAGDMSSAVAACGIARTKDLDNWERLPDLISQSPQQRNVVLHPEFVGGKYALYTRPQDGFIDAGKGGGIGWALCDSMENATVGFEQIVDPKEYHTIKETKNGLGPAPIKTAKGWLHIAHGVRNTAAGLRYTLYCFLCDLNAPEKIIALPGGYFMAPIEGERVGDVSNVLFCNGAIERNGEIHIYYASSDTRIHVATTTVDKMLDYVLNTPSDGLRSFASVEAINRLVAKNGTL